MEQSALIFTMSVKRPPVDWAYITLKAPTGFIFPRFCQVWTDEDEVGLKYESTPWDREDHGTPWPGGKDGYRNCRGELNVATFEVMPGMFPDERYSFRINVEQNPDSTPARNIWTLQYDEEASMPFPGFEIWYFRNITIFPVSEAVCPKNNRVAAPWGPSRPRARPAAGSSG